MNLVKRWLACLLTLVIIMTNSLGTVNFVSAAEQQDTESEENIISTVQEDEGSLEHVHEEGETCSETTTTEERTDTEVGTETDENATTVTEEHTEEATEEGESEAESDEDGIVLLAEDGTASTEVTEEEAVWKVPTISIKYIRKKNQVLFWHDWKWEQQEETISYKYYKKIEDAFASAVGGEWTEYEGDATEDCEIEGAIKTKYTTKAMVVLTDDYTLKESVTIPSGVTLLLPYKNGNGVDSLNESGDGKGADAESGDGNSYTFNVPAAWDAKDKLNHTLNIPEGKQLTVQGTLIVSGVWGPTEVDSIQGLTCGSYSKIHCDGSIEINQGGNVFVYGLIDGSGCVTTYEGGTIYEPFLIYEFLGGQRTWYLSSNDKEVFPFTQYTFNNIQCDTIYRYGSQLKGMAKIYLGSNGGYMKENIIVIGSGNEGFLKLENDAQILTSYKRDTLEKLTFTFWGNITIGTIAIKISTYGTFDTTGKYLAVPYNFDFVMKKGNYIIPNDVKIKVMPGATIRVEEEANLNVAGGGALVVYDGLKQSGIIKQYPEAKNLKQAGFSTAGNIVVDGTLNIENGATYAGIIQTKGKGKISVGETATLYIDNHREGFYAKRMLQGDNKCDNTTKFNISAQYWNGYEFKNLEPGKIYTAYTGSNEKLKTSDIVQFRCSSWNDGPSTTHQSTAESLCTVCNTDCCVIPIEFSETRTGAWNIAEVTLRKGTGFSYQIDPIKDSEGNVVRGYQTATNGDGNTVVYVPYGENLNFTINPEAGYAIDPETLIVKKNESELSPISGADNKKTTTFSVTIESEDKQEIWVNDTNYKYDSGENAQNGIYNIPPTGSISVTAGSATIGTWNEESDTKADSLIKDKGAVSVTINAEDTEETPTVQYYQTEEKVSNIQDEKIPWKDYGTDTVIILEGDTVVYIYAKITDEAGNVLYISTPKLILDNNVPSVSIALDGENPVEKELYYNSSKSFVISANDNGSGIKSVEYIVNDKDTVGNETGWTSYDYAKKPTVELSLTEKENKTYYIHVKAVDNAGHSVQFATKKIVLDNVVPTGTITVSDAGTCENADTSSVFKDTPDTKKTNCSKKVVITAASENEDYEAETVQYYIAESQLDLEGVKALKEDDWKEYKKEILLTAPDTGSKSYIVYVRLADKAGNVTYLSTNQYVLDKVKPEITITLDKNHVWNGTNSDKKATVTFNDKEDKEITVLGKDENGSGVKEIYYICSNEKQDNIAIQGFPWQQGTLAEDNFFKITLEDNQRWYVYAYGIDQAGNISEIVETAPILLDSIMPTGTVTILGIDKTFSILADSVTKEPKYYKSAPSVTINADDTNLATVEYYIHHTEDGTSILTEDSIKNVENWNVVQSEKEIYSFFADSKSLSKDNPVFMVYVKITDQAGNTTYISTCNLRIDGDAPVITTNNGAIKENATVYAEEDASLQVIIKDKNLVEVTVDGQKQEYDTNNTFTLKPKKENKDYVIKAIDKAGNETTLAFKYLEYCKVSFENHEGTVKEESDYIYSDGSSGSSESEGKNKITFPNQEDYQYTDETQETQYELIAWKSGDKTYTYGSSDNQEFKIDAQTTVWTPVYQAKAYKVTYPDEVDRTTKGYQIILDNSEDLSVETSYVDIGKTVSFQLKATEEINNTQKYIVTVVSKSRTETIARTQNQENDIETLTPDDNGVYSYEITRETGPVQILIDIDTENSHIWAYTGAFVEPTCTSKGLDIYTCKDCGVTKVSIKPALGHENKNVEKLEATCTESGHEEGKKCNRCGYVTGCKEILATGHTFGDWVTEAATCTKEGKRTRSCTKCSESEEEILSKKEHTYNEAKVTAPTCTEKGYTTHTCNCGDSYQDSYVDVKGHTYQRTSIIKEATCSEKGAELWTCSACENTEQRDVDYAPKNHSYSDQEVEETCTTAGYTLHTCEWCGNQYYDNLILPKNHDWNQKTCLQKESCIQTGLYVYECKNCSATKLVQQDKTAHSYEVIEAKAAICTEIGWDKYEKCSICGEEKGYKEIPATGHTEVTDLAKNADCGTGTTGLTEGKHCSICKEILVKQEEIPISHSFGEWEMKEEATCTTKGMEERQCSECYKTETRETETNSKNHDYQKIVIVPTCTSEGYTIYTCSRCNHQYISDWTEKTVHTWCSKEEADVLQKQTCTENGKLRYHCENCGATKIETEQKKNHTYIDHSAKDSTCEEKGWDAYVTCQNCDYTTYKEIPATGHTEVADKAVEATCETTGKTKGSHCSVCDKILVEQEVIPATGHMEVIDEAVKATCKATGLTVGSHCSVCDKVLVKQETVPKTDHKIVIDEAVEATCEAPGKTEGSHCSVCDEIIKQQETVEAKGHEYQTAVINEPTCTNAGLQVRHCNTCNKTYYDAIKELGHEYKDVTVSPTCMTKGYTTHTCIRCDHTYTDSEQDKLEHKEVVDKAVEPTCTTTGLTEGSHCSVCGTVIKAQEKVEAKGHSYSDWEVHTAATCSEEGEERRTCTVNGCEAYESRTIEALGHDYSTVVTAPTCENKGYTTYTCKRENCGHSEKGSYVDALGHDYRAKVVDPTCTKGGYTEFTCQRAECGHTYQDYIKDALGHKTVVDKAVEATCTSTGLTEGSHCSVCNEMLKAQTVVPVKGHNYEEKTASGSCEEDGYKTYTCKDCGHSYNEVIEEASGHKWSEDSAKVVIEPTCTTAGIKIYTCTDCGETKMVPMDELGHSYVVSRVPATCKDTGYTKHQCARCGDSYQTDEIEALGHEICHHDGQAATCSLDGWEAFDTCTRCDYTTYEKIPALGHKYTETVTKPTCTEEGYTTFICENCVHTYQGEKVEAKGHRMDDYKVTVKPTCTKVGTETSKCKDCDHEITREVKATGHDYKEKITKVTCIEDGYTTYTCSRCKDSYKDDIVKATGHKKVLDGHVEATCETDGLTEGSHCSVCEEILVEQKVIPATGHQEEVDFAKKATCETDGLTEGSHCSVCNKVLEKQEIIPATGHNFVEGTPVINPTCTTAGFRVDSCSSCGETKVVPLDALGHECEKEVVAPTCETAGYTIYRCKRCDSFYMDEPVEANGHTLEKKVVTPTCTEAGYTIYSCISCDYTKTEDRVSATGHTEVMDEAIAPTCLTSGLTEGKHCSVCHTVLKEQKEVAALGHDLEKQVVEANCKKDGYTRYSCTRCDYENIKDQTKGQHQYKASVTGEATEEKNGTMTYKCVVCGDTYTRVIPADTKVWQTKWTSSSAVINWNSVTPDHAETVGYEIWTAEEENGAYQKAADVPESDHNYTFADKESGISFYVKIKSYTDKNEIRVYGEETDAILVSTKPAQTFGIATKAIAPKNVQVTWNAVKNAYGYEIYKSLKKNGTYTYAATVTGKDTSAVIYDLYPATTQYFKVRAFTYYNGRKVYGTFSAISEVTTTPKQTTVTLTAKKKKITVKWKKIYNASGYKIYRATKKNGKYKLIKTISGNKKFSYIDRKAVSGRKYFYKVAAYRKTAKGRAALGPYSRVKSVKAK